jgi:hypothetical protein
MTFVPRIIVAIKENNIDNFVQLLGASNTARRIISNDDRRRFYHDIIPEYINSPFDLCAFHCRYEMLTYILNIENMDVNQRNNHGHNVLATILCSNHAPDLDYNLATVCAQLL